MYNIPTPTMSQVIMVDDPITTAEFVISALRDFFDKSLEEAQALTVRALDLPLKLLVEEIK
ncbi:ATP-dependent Clp protease adaptor ClpS [Helicobacter pylori]